MIDRPPRIGDIFMFKFVGNGGSAQAGHRPGVIFQNNLGNMHSPNVVVLPITSNIKKKDQVTHVVIRAEDTGLYKDSMILCENPRTFPVSRIGPYITTLPDHYLKELATATILSSSIISYLDRDELLKLYDKAVRLNSYTAESDL